MSNTQGEASFVEHGSGAAGSAALAPSPRDLSALMTLQGAQGWGPHRQGPQERMAVKFVAVLEGKEMRVGSGEIDLYRETVGDAGGRDQWGRKSVFSKGPR